MTFASVGFAMLQVAYLVVVLCACLPLLIFAIPSEVFLKNKPRLRYNIACALVALAGLNVVILCFAAVYYLAR